MSDFSATTDLYQIVANVYAMRLLALDRQALIMLAGSILAPFVPVVLMDVPSDKILDALKGLLL